MTHTFDDSLFSLRLALILCVLHVLVLVVCGFVATASGSAVGPACCLRIDRCSLVQSWRLWRIDEPWMLSLPSNSAIRSSSMASIANGLACNPLH